MNPKDMVSSGEPASSDDGQGASHQKPGEWIKLGRHDLVAFFHGLRDLREIGACALLVGHYLSAPGPVAVEALVDIVQLDPAKSDALTKRLVRLGRIRIDGDLLFIPILDEKITLAATATAKGKELSRRRWRGPDV